MYVKPKDLSAKGGQLSVDYGIIPGLRKPDKRLKGRKRMRSTFAKTGAKSFTLHLWKNYGDLNHLIYMQSRHKNIFL